MNNDKKKSFLSNFSSTIFLSLVLTSIVSISLTYLGLYFKIIDFKISDLILRILVACFLCVFATIIICLITSYGTKKYNEDLANAILEASKGNFNYKINPNENSLFKDVSIAFNKMSDELSQIEILRSDFIANFSHECRTPINSICNYAELLGEPSLTDEERQEFIKIIITESKRLSVLSDSILQLANVGVKTAHFEIVPIRMDELLKEIIVENDQKIGNIDLKYAIDEVTVKSGNVKDEEFTGQTNIEMINLPNDVVGIGNDAFNGCRALTTINIPENLESIGVRAFSGCRGLTSLVIPNSVEYIGEDAFYDCRGLTSISLPLTQETTFRAMFNFADFITYQPLVVTITKTYNVGIRQQEFANSFPVVSINLPNDVADIGMNAFFACQVLTYINIPENVWSIGTDAFWDCNLLETIVIDSKWVYLGVNSGNYGGLLAYATTVYVHKDAYDYGTNTYLNGSAFDKNEGTGEWSDYYVYTKK